MLGVADVGSLRLGLPETVCGRRLHFSHTERRGPVHGRTETRDTVGDPQGGSISRLTEPIHDERCRVDATRESGSLVYTTRQSGSLGLVCGVHVVVVSLPLLHGSDYETEDVSSRPPSSSHKYCAGEERDSRPVPARLTQRGGARERL